MKTFVRLNEAQLQKLIAQLQKLISEELNELGMGQARAQGPLKKFVDHMNGAKQALSELYQTTTDRKAGEHCYALLNAVNRITKALEHMPELTQDAWHGVRKRG